MGLGLKRDCCDLNSARNSGHERRTGHVKGCPLSLGQEGGQSWKTAKSFSTLGLPGSLRLSYPVRKTTASRFYFVLF